MIKVTIEKIFKDNEMVENSTTYGLRTDNGEREYLYEVEISQDGRFSINNYKARIDNSDISTNELIMFFDMVTNAIVASQNSQGE